jgi:hypothetical protein
MVSEGVKYSPLRAPKELCRHTNSGCFAALVLFAPIPNFLDVSGPIDEFPRLHASFILFPILTYFNPHSKDAG